MEIEHHASSSTIRVQDGPFAGQTVPVSIMIQLFKFLEHTL